MNKIFYKLNLLLLSFFGIGYIRGFRAFFTSIVAMLIAFSIPDKMKTEILLIGIIIFITFFTYVSNICVNGNNKEYIVFNRAIGIWIACISPYVMITVFWAVVCLGIYFLMFKFISNTKLGQRKSKHQKIDFLKNDILAGLITGIILQILFSGVAIFPFINMFWQR